MGGPGTGTRAGAGARAGAEWMVGLGDVLSGMLLGMGDMVTSRGRVEWWEADKGKRTE